MEKVERLFRDYLSEIEMSISDITCDCIALRFFQDAIDHIPASALSDIENGASTMLSMISRVLSDDIDSMFEQMEEAFVKLNAATDKGKDDEPNEPGGSVGSE